MLNALTDQSGSGVRFWSIGKELARLGHSVFFLERSIGKNRRGKRKGIEYRACLETGVLWLDILRATLLNLFHGLLFRPDYLFALKPLPNSSMPALLLKYIFKTKIILDIDDLDFAYYPNKFRQNLVRFCFKLFPPCFDHITTHNRHLQSFITDEIGIPPRKIYFLAQGIETEQFVRAKPAERYRRQWLIFPEDRVLVYSASLGITTDFNHVLPMLIELLRSCDDIRVLVIGAGIRKPYFAKAVEAYGLQERMIFTGYVPHAEMPGVLKLARVGINYMAPTKANQCRASIKVREYLAAGLDVVCNPVGDAELFRDYVTLCSSIEEFPHAIRKTLALKNREKIKEAQGYLERNYGWPGLVEDFLVHITESPR